MPVRIVNSPRVWGSFLLFWLLFALNAHSQTPIDHPALHNLLQITDTIYSGGEPHGEESFKALRALGVTTIVSVDGATPDLELARKYDLRYVHIPIGYDGIDEHAGASFARLAWDVDGPMYVHCHHGKHRGPAAAAVACIAAGELDGPAALAILEAAGTSRDYSGLWRDVENYEAPPAGSELPELVEVAQVDSLAAAMAKLDRHWDNLKRCRKNNWTTPEGHPDLVPAQEALLVFEALRESARHLGKDYDAQFAAWLRGSETLADDLHQGLKTERNPELEARFEALQNSCNQCHDLYRN